MFRKISVLFFYFAFGCQLSGCVAVIGAAAGGAGTATWLGGKLSQKVYASVESTHRAAVRALAEMDFVTNKETVTDQVTQIVGQTSTGRPFWIDIRPIDSKETRLDVRVGVPGDQVESRKLFDRITSKLWNKGRA